MSDPGKPWLKSPFWVTPGGRVERGEDVASAAAREIREETGLVAVLVGPAVWYGEQILLWRGRETRLKETFVVARSLSARLTSAHWTAQERAFIREMRWWTVPEIESTSETILPPVLRRLLRAVAQGEHSREVQTVSLGTE